jgi:hypothetical protein
MTISGEGSMTYKIGDEFVKTASDDVRNRWIEQGI